LDFCLLIFLRAGWKNKLLAIEYQNRKFNSNFSAITSKGARSHLILEAYLEE